MPRQSKLTVAARFRPTMPGDRPFAPDSLRDDMKIEWGSVVDRLPSRWFTAIELRGLEGFCRTVCYCKEVASELDKVKLSDADDPKVDFQRRAAHARHGDRRPHGIRRRS